MQKKIIIIPVYESKPSTSESLAFQQGLKVLHKHRFCIISYQTLDISYYIKLAEKEEVDYSIEFFNKESFTSIKGYNRLLLNMEFYRRFRKYEYLLIYQLDAYVFRDELDYWCNKGYDYIGAPWFENFSSNEIGNQLWTVGNGGFSLRRNSTILGMARFNKPIRTIRELKTYYSIPQTLTGKLKRLLMIYIKATGYKNNLAFWMRKWERHEDIFWSHFFLSLKVSFAIAPCNEAMYFSFEKSPQHLYNMNGHRLPFGCHAWAKHQYQTFWKQFIDEPE